MIISRSTTRGLFRHTFWVTLFLVVMLAIAGCGRDNNDTSSSQTSASGEAAASESPTSESPTSESNPAEPASGTPVQQESTDGTETTEAATSDNGSAASTGNPVLDAVAAALRKQASSLPMRMTMTSSEGNETDTFVAEIASPTRMRINADDMEILMVDGTVYLKEDGEWIANEFMAGMAGAMMGQFLPDGIEAQVNTLVDAEQLADEEVNGEAVSVYRFRVDAPEEDASEAMSQVYVRKSDGLPVRMTSADGTEYSFQIDYSYDPSIVIEAPQ